MKKSSHTIKFKVDDKQEVYNIFESLGGNAYFKTIAPWQNIIYAIVELTDEELVLLKLRGGPFVMNPVDADAVDRLFRTMVDDKISNIIRSKYVP